MTPVEGNQALPWVGDPSTWASKTVRRPLYAAQPLITTIATTASRGGSRYHSLQSSVRQRKQHGVEFMASYTLAKARTSEAEWGPAVHDVRHNVLLSGTWELPFGKDRAFGSDWSTLADSLLGGWRLGGIFQARSGMPITVTDGRSRSLQGERGAERPNCVGDPVPSDQSINKWLDINAFAAVPLGTFGTCPVGVARAPGLAARARTGVQVLLLNVIGQ